MATMAEDSRFDDNMSGDRPPANAGLVVALASTLFVVIMLVAGVLASTGAARAMTLADAAIPSAGTIAGPGTIAGLCVMLALSVVSWRLFGTRHQQNMLKRRVRVRSSR